MNCVTFKHSSRRRPLNDSMWLFSVGFPGWMKSSFTPRWYAQSSSPRDAASRGSSGSQSAAARAQSRGCAAAAPTDPERRSSHTTRSARSRRAAALCAPSPRNAPESTGPAHDGALASELFSDHLAQDVFIEREIGYETLQARVLITQLAELADLGEPELGVLLLPEVKARLAHPDLTAHIRHRCAAFRLAQRHGNLLIRKTLPLHGPLLPIWRTSEVSLVQF